MEMIPVKPELKGRLEVYARQHGQSPADALNDLLDAQLRPELQEPELSQEEWVRKLRDWGEGNAGKNLPVLPDEALRRENMYEDCAL